MSASHPIARARPAFARYAQCQIAFTLAGSPATGLAEAADPAAQAGKVLSCVTAARADSATVVVLPELSLALPVTQRDALLWSLTQIARDANMIIVAGSYYDAQRHNRLVVIGPGWMEQGYKTRPSRFEASPRAGLGMTPANEILLLDTDFGRIVVITCVDLISDAVQFAVRNLANRGAMDVLVNINYNPASWEFLIEANSIVRRHPVFATITNVTSPPTGACLSGGRPEDTGYCFGHSAVFASLRTSAADAPNSAVTVLRDLPPQFIEGTGTTAHRMLAYDDLVADPGAFFEGLIVYDLNLRLPREPLSTNAPDQGYPTVRDIRYVPLSR
jgi:predicted amidohydrolase